MCGINVLYIRTYFSFFLFIHVYDRAISEANGRLGVRLTGLSPLPGNMLLNRPFQGDKASDFVLCCCLFWCQFLFSPSECLDDI